MEKNEGITLVVLAVMMVIILILTGLTFTMLHKSETKEMANDIVNRTDEYLIDQENLVESIRNIYR